MLTLIIKIHFSTKMYRQKKNKKKQTFFLQKSTVIYSYSCDRNLNIQQCMDTPWRAISISASSIRKCQQCIVTIILKLIIYNNINKYLIYIYKNKLQTIKFLPKN